MSDIFISYACADESRARELAAALARLGWSVWYDRALIPSEEYDKRIERELDAARCVIVIWSRASTESAWVRAEASAADQQGKLLPITFDPGVVPPIRFQQLHFAKLSTPALEPLNDEAINAFISELSRRTGRSPKGWTAANRPVTPVGSRSGARMVTAGHWFLTSGSFFFKQPTYDLEFLANGMVTGKVGWLNVSGKWQYDSSRENLQLDLDVAGSEGMKSYTIKIIEWIDDDTANCTFWLGRWKLKRVFG